MKKLNKEKGITLIALVITIIVLLILAGVSIAALSGQDGILTKASESKTTTAEKSAKEALEMVLDEWQIEKYTGTQTLKEFLTSKVPNSLDAVIGEGPFEVEKDGYIATVNSEGELTDIAKAGPRPTVPTDTKVVLASEGSGEGLPANSQNEGTTLYINFTSSIEGGTITNISPALPFTVTENGTTTFTITGTVNGEDYTRQYSVKVNQYKSALQVGKFVNYSAGDWKQTDIDKLGSLYVGSNALPTSSNQFQFGGFKVGDSKDKSTEANSIAKPPYNTYSNTYTSGWRVLSVDGDTVKIVSAGTPEAYYHQNSTNYGYKSEYILSGKKNASDTSTITEGVSPRDWSMYVNSTYATSATSMTYNDAYGITGSTSSTSNDLRKTGSYYWLASAYISDGLWYVGGDGRFYGNNNNCFGVRPVVTLKSGIQVTGGSGTQADPYQLGI